MKILSAFLFTVVAVCGFIAFAEAGIFTDIITYIKTNVPMAAGKIPWSAFMILLATGIIGILGIRRRG
jgi:polyferredoxin